MAAPVIAFVYARLREDLNPIYAGLADGLVENVATVMPGVRLLHIADDDTEAVKGCDVVRIPRKVLPMSWRLVAQSLAHSVHDEILFTEPDVRFRVPVMDVFGMTFDVVVADRETATILKGKKMPPITLGSNFSRSAEFWKDCAKFCLKLDRKEQLWGGDMDAVQHVIESGKYAVLTLPAAQYNHIPTSPDDDSGKVQHYKGTRKTWLFKAASENIATA